MRSDPVELDGQAFDYMVVGGGIQAAALARELALRECSVLLVTCGDFAAETSAQSIGLLHGGLDQLLRRQISRVREGLVERQRLLMTAAHIVRPLPLLMPFFGDSGGPPVWASRLGMRLYSALGRGSTLPAPVYYKPEDCLRIFPGLRRSGLSGGCLFFEASCNELSLNLALLKSAHESGAALVNHVELQGVDRQGPVFRDKLFDRQLRFRSKHVINAAGAAVDQLRQSLGLGESPLLQVRKSSHRLPSDVDTETGLATYLPSGRLQFMIPQAGAELLALGDEGSEEAGATVQVQDLDFMFEKARGPAEVPAPILAAPIWTAPANGREIDTGTGLMSEPWEHGLLHTVLGADLSRHRLRAERSVNDLLGRRDPTPSRELVLPGGAGLQDPGDPLWWRYGSRAPVLRKMARGRPELMQPIAPDRDHLRVEAVYALRELGAVTFTDLMLRRLSHRLGPSMDEESLRDMHALYLQERLVEVPADYEADRRQLAEAAARSR